MQIHLEELEHQRRALDAILGAAPKLYPAPPMRADSYANPRLEYAGNEYYFIDIKMETGTGKTYVYTRAMYELHRKLGLFKFIIIVPSLAIKEGAKNFIDSSYARQHFSQFFLNKRIALQTINAGDFAARKGRKSIPAALTQFCGAAGNDRNTIQCLLISDKGFLDRSSSALFKDEYDQTFFDGASRPADALKNIRPIVIIDEPHRLKRSGKSYKNLIEQIAPQMIIRFGATFPEGKDGKPDYYRGEPQYDLDAVQAFNQDLVKGVEVQFPNLPENARTIFKVKSVTKKDLTLARGGAEYILKAGDELSEAGAGFEGGIIYEGDKKLSNGLELESGMSLIEGIFSNSYQEILLSLALDAHFETEEKNFARTFKVKTITLFFIDNIASYRDEGGWLKTCFERLLREKLEVLLQKHKEGLYHDFLRATVDNMAAAHGGYFAKDWGEPDDSAIAGEVEDILHKERTLTFKKADGGWNIRRFFFSKWTLREGWDNPNVFTICKLRSSGSESSKLQEVGRGLRLPVDEQGNRLSGEDWRLNFIIGWNEEGFAKKLIGEINSDASVPMNEERLTDAMLKAICDLREIASEALLRSLDEMGITNRDNSFKKGGYEKLLKTYPELLQNQLKGGKVLMKGEKAPNRVKLRRENWEKIREFWQEISRRYMFVLQRLGAEAISELFAEVLRDARAFNDNSLLTVEKVRTRKEKDGNGLSLSMSETVTANRGGQGLMPYHEFAARLARRTCIPLQIIHRELWSRLLAFHEEGMSGEDINSLLNQRSYENIIDLWADKFAEQYAAKYEYNPLSFTANTSVLKNGSFVEDIASGVIGIMPAHDIEDDVRNLYEPPLYYDSETEHEVEKATAPGNISVFGKIPRRAIKVPTYTGGSTTPDFIYAAERNGRVALTLLVETKAQSMRMKEERIVEAQERFFSGLKNLNVKWDLVQDAGRIHELLRKMAAEG